MFVKHSARGRRAGTAACLGNYNWNGQYGTGSTSPATPFTQMGTATNLVAIATGTWDQFCSLDTQGQVRCSGYMFGSTPVPAGTSTTGRLWVTEFGTAAIDDPAVFRASNSRSSCKVTAGGLECTPGPGVPSGTAGTVVDGFRFGPPGPIGELRCWLDSGGHVVTARECGRSEAAEAG